MPMFMVKFEATIFYEVEVEAETEDQAQALATAIVRSNPRWYESDSDGINLIDSALVQ